MGSFGVVSLYWSESLLAELRRVHLRDGVPVERAEKMNSYLRNGFPEGFVDCGDVDPVSLSLVFDPDDAYLVQLAREVGDATLVTNNITDFDMPDLLNHGIQVVRPNEDLMALWNDGMSRDAILASLERQQDRRNFTSIELLNKLRGAQCEAFADEVASEFF